MILLEEFINPANITPYRVAKDSGISQPTMNQIVNGKRPISTETALRLATYFGTSCELWVNLQKNYDLRIAERDLLPRIQAEVKPLQLGATSYQLLTFFGLIMAMTLNMNHAYVL